METVSEMEPTNFDEFSMQQSLLFSDSLKDLKNLRSQLYSAAEYFELSYTTDDHKQFVVNTLKDYAIKALINTVDHLGSVSFKINGLLDEKVDEVSGAEFRISCIEQRIRTCQELVDREGLCQQSLVIKTPTYHKQYLMPVGGCMPDSAKQALPKYEEVKTFKENNENYLSKSGELPPPSFRKTQTISRSPSLQARSVSPKKLRSLPSQLAAKNFVAEKRAISPLPVSNLLARSGSLAVRASNLNPTLNNTIRRTFSQYPSAPQKSSSMRLHAERDDEKDSEQSQNKGKKLLKTLLSRRKSKKDDKLYSYLDEY